MPGYNGFKSWTQWNVSLWINNDVGLYRQAKEFRRIHSQRESARLMLEWLHGIGATHTPDGAKYTVTNLIVAIRGLQGCSKCGTARHPGIRCE